MPRFIYKLKPSEKSEDDHMYSIKERDLTVLPIKYDLRTATNCVPDVLDQGQLGCCAGNEISNALRYCLKKEHAIDFQPSRLFIYYFARMIDGSPVAQDTGITIKAGMTCVQKFGACNEIKWPYYISKYQFQPSKDAIADSKTHIPNFTCTRVPQDLMSIKHALFSGFPIIVGISVYSSLECESTITTGEIPMPNTSSETLNGGHCVSLYGYDDTTKRFIMMNSWGISVGQHGWFTIPYEYILNSDLCCDLWTITFYK